MEKITFKDLVEVTRGARISLVDDTYNIDHLIIDSRKSNFVKGSIFFAIQGERHDGHEYLMDLYNKGVRQFVVERPVDPTRLTGSNILQVDNCKHALQQLAALKRRLLNPEVIGITGSNGKTIIKEWLYQLLLPYKRTVKSPHSYNSQIGVPLSVWQLSEIHETAIFEAGISQSGEMERLQFIIQPTIGIFTNIGSAHDSGFSSVEEKVREKCKLFKECLVVVYCKDYTEVDRQLVTKGFTWGWHEKSNIKLTNTKQITSGTLITFTYKGETLQLHLPFTDKASLENCMHCIVYMLYQGYPIEQIQQGISQLHHIRMRLEQKKGINHCSIIDDVYNNDLGGIQIALDLLANHHLHSRKTVIISDILQSGLPQNELYQMLSEMLLAAGVTRLIGIGKEITQYRGVFDNFESCFYSSTEDFLANMNLNDFKEEIILVKGARIFAFERIVKALEEKIHGTYLEINLDALTSNLNFYRSRLLPGVKLMVMVKAFAYGSGSLEVANLLQFHHVDYLGVAYSDEGMALRKNGIQLPIMVMNPNEDSFDKLYEYNLETTIYNFRILHQLIRFSEGREINIHLELETGMQRLGFSEEDIPELVACLQKHRNIKIKSIFSHLAGADESVHEDFSRQQAQHFEKLSTRVMELLEISPIRHLLNSPGILRYPEYQFDMVRLGIGLYGYEANNIEQGKLQPVSSLKTVVSQVKQIQKGQSVGYSRKGIAGKNDLTIATIAIGYADGFSRALSNGVGEVWINGHKAPVIGNVCMDMTMVDVTGMNVKEGDEVEIFGDHITISEMASKINTIPYEILTNVSQRVKRIYYTE